MHYNQLITGKNKKISYNFFMDYLLSIEKKVKKHPYPNPNPNRYPNFFSSFDQNIAHSWSLFCMNLNKHNTENKNINF
jgi:hypothetical protein